MISGAMKEESLNIIEVRNLSKNFGDFKAVKDISFTVEKSEVFGFLGPNGAGKTTTINMLTGLAKPSAGEIVISGQDGIKKNQKGTENHWHYSR